MFSSAPNDSHRYDDTDYSRKKSRILELMASLSSQGPQKVASLLLETKIDLTFIAEILIKEDKFDLLNALITKNKYGLCHFVFNIVEKGDIAALKKMVLTGMNLNFALTGALKTANCEIINYLCSLGAKADPVLLSCCLSFHYSLTRKALEMQPLYFLAHIDDATLRNDLARISEKKLETPDAERCLEQANKLNPLIRKAGMTFEQAQEYITVMANSTLDNEALVKQAGKVTMLMQVGPLTILQALGYLEIGATHLLFQERICLERFLPIEIHYYMLSLMTGLFVLEDNKKVHEVALAKVAIRSAHVRNSIFSAEKESEEAIPQSRNDQPPLTPKRN